MRWEGFQVIGRDGLQGHRDLEQLGAARRPGLRLDQRGQEQGLRQLRPVLRVDAARHQRARVLRPRAFIERAVALPDRGGHVRGLRHLRDHEPEPVQADRPRRHARRRDAWRLPHLSDSGETAAVCRASRRSAPTRSCSARSTRSSPTWSSAPPTTSAGSAQIIEDVSPDYGNTYYIANPGRPRPAGLEQGDRGARRARPTPSRWPRWPSCRRALARLPAPRPSSPRPSATTTRSTITAAKRFSQDLVPQRVVHLLAHHRQLRRPLPGHQRPVRPEHHVGLRPQGHHDQHEGPAPAGLAATPSSSAATSRGSCSRRARWSRASRSARQEGYPLNVLGHLPGLRQPGDLHPAARRRLAGPRGSTPATSRSATSRSCRRPRRWPSRSTSSTCSTSTRRRASTSSTPSTTRSRSTTAASPTSATSRTSTGRRRSRCSTTTATRRRTRCRSRAASASASPSSNLPTRAASRRPPSRGPAFVCPLPTRAACVCPGSRTCPESGRTGAVAAPRKPAWRQWWARGTRRALPEGVLTRVLSAALVGIDAYLVEVEVDLAGGLPGYQLVGLPATATVEGRVRIRARAREQRPRHPAAQGQRQPRAGRRAQGRRRLRPPHRRRHRGGGRAARRGAGWGASCCSASCRSPAPSSRSGARSPSRSWRGSGASRASSCRAPTSPRPRWSRACGPAAPPPWHEVVAFLAGAGELPEAACAGEALRPGWHGTADRAAGAAPGRGRHAPTRPPRTTSPTCAARPRPSGPWRSRRPAATTWCSSARRAAARPCSPAGCRRCCPRSASRRRWPSPGSTRWRACSGRGPGRAAPVPRAPPLDQRGRARGRRVALPPGRGVAGAPRGAVPRRAARVRPRRPRGAAPAARGRAGQPGPRAAGGAPSRPPSRWSRAANPCPCGFLGSTVRGCTCSPPAVARYRARLSGPLLDRIDLQVAVQPTPFRDLRGPPNGEGSAAIRARVEAARAVQRRRLAPAGALVQRRR